MTDKRHGGADPDPENDAADNASLPNAAETAAEGTEDEDLEIDDDDDDEDDDIEFDDDDDLDEDDED